MKFPEPLFSYFYPNTRLSMTYWSRGSCRLYVWWLLLFCLLFDITVSVVIMCSWTSELQHGNQCPCVYMFGGSPDWLFLANRQITGTAWENLFPVSRVRNHPLSCGIMGAPKCTRIAVVTIVTTWARRNAFCVFRSPLFAFRRTRALLPRRDWQGSG